jgi:hypothetical protein
VDITAARIEARVQEQGRLTHFENKRPRGVLGVEVRRVTLHVPYGMHRDVRPDAVRRHYQGGPARQQHVLPQEVGLVTDLVLEAVQLGSGAEAKSA